MGAEKQIDRNTLSLVESHLEYIIYYLEYWFLDGAKRDSNPVLENLLNEFKES